MEEDVKKAGSPVLGNRFLKETAAEGEAVFSSVGAVHKTGLLTLIVVAAASYAWTQPWVFMPALLPLVLINLAVAFGIFFVPSLAPFLAPAYAALEGLILGTISSAYEGLYQGIVFQAAAGTMAILAVMVIGYSTGVLKLGQRGKAVVMACTMGLALTYLISMIAGFFGYQAGFMHEGTPLGIAVSLFALAIAALNFSLDFEFIEEAQKANLAKRMEWYAAFGVLVTLVWVYLEMLRLLSKLRKK